MSEIESSGMRNSNMNKMIECYSLLVYGISYMFSLKVAVCKINYVIASHGHSLIAGFKVELYLCRAPEWFDPDWMSKLKRDISGNHRLKVPILFFVPRIVVLLVIIFS